VALEFHREGDSVVRLDCDCHQSVTQVLVDSHALMGSDSTRNRAELAQELRCSAITVLFGEGGEAREVNEDECPSESHNCPQPRGVTSVLSEGSVHRTSVICISGADLAE
jgi:hypothetical protein